MIRIPAGHASGRVTVLVDLRLPPLAAAYGRGLIAFSAHRRLNTRSSASRAYLARLARVQAQAAAQIRRAIPKARITNRYRVVLDGFALRLPYRALPKLAALSAVRKVYPSLGYHLDTNKSPSVIHADTFWATTGGRGQGVKIGVVDDGVDQANAFFNPAGFSYPAGFPKGQTAYTTQKVIVARAFPGPGSGKQGRLPFFAADSFHGTHVAGIAAGVAGTLAPAGPDHPQVTGLSGIAPRAWIGNYRVFNAPTLTGGLDAFTPQIVQAFESAVNDGMDVINFSGGGPEANPSSDALIEATDNVAAAGVVPVIAAGNDRDEFGLGSVGSPSNAPDAISVAATSNLHVFGPEMTVTGAGAPASLQHIPFSFNQEVPPTWLGDQQLVDIGTIVGTNLQPVERHLCAPPGFDPNDDTRSTLAPGAITGKIALVSRGGCTFDSKAERVRRAGGSGMILVDNRSGEANFIPFQLSVRSGMIADLDGANLRAFMDAHGGTTTFRVSSDEAFHEIQTGRSGVITSFSSGGPTNYDHRLKPDLAAPGGQILSSTVTKSIGEPFAVFDGTSMATPHVAGAAALLLQQHPGWSPRQVKSALMSSAGPAWGDTARTQEASVLLEGSGLVNVAAADDPKLFTDPDLALVRVPRHDERQRSQGPAALAQRRGRRLRDVVGLARRPGRELGRLGHSGRLARHRRSRRDRRRADRRLGGAGLPERRRLRVRRPPARRRPRSRSLLLPRRPCRRSAARRGSRSSATRSTTRARARTSSTPTAIRPIRSGRRPTTPARGCTRTAPSTSTPSTSTAMRRTSARPWSRAASARWSSRGSWAR